MTLRKNKKIKDFLITENWKFFENRFNRWSALKVLTLAVEIPLLSISELYV